MIVSTFLKHSDKQDTKVFQHLLINYKKLLPSSLVLDQHQTVAFRHPVTHAAYQSSAQHATDLLLQAFLQTLYQLKEPHHGIPNLYNATILHLP